MIDIEKLKADFADGRAVNSRNVKALIEEVDAGKVTIFQLQARTEAAEKRIAELEAAARWIPVSEKLPEEGQEVIVMDRDGFVSNWWHGIKWARMLTENYAYWMPLPQPPKPEEVEG